MSIFQTAFYYQAIGFEGTFDIRMVSSLLATLLSDDGRAVCRQSAAPSQSTRATPGHGSPLVTNETPQQDNAVKRLTRRIEVKKLNQSFLRSVRGLPHGGEVRHSMNLTALNAGLVRQ